MKKLLSLLLCIALVLSLTACAKEGAATETTLPEVTENQVYTPPADVDTEPSVYFLNHEPELDPVWQQLADEYEAATGTKVLVLTAAKGTYFETLAWELERDAPVTLFHAEGLHSLEGLEVSCYDLSDTSVLSSLADRRLALTKDGAVVGIPAHTESLGLLVNTALLNEAGYQLEDVLTLEGLRAAAESITENSAELGFSAFAVPSLSSAEKGTAELLAALAVGLESLGGGKVDAGLLGTHVGELRGVWDIATQNFGDDPAELMNQGATAMRDAFAGRQAVFCFGGSWSYEDLRGPLGEGLALIPVPTENGGVVSVGTDSYWVVNAGASEADLRATLGFLTWCLTEKVQVLTGEMGMILPYGADGLDPLTAQALDSDATVAPLCFWATGDGGWLLELSTALTVYASDLQDANWDLVTESFKSR